MNLFEQIVLAQHSVFEFDLGVLLFKFLADFCFWNQDSASRQVAQLVQQDVELHVLLEHRDTQVGVLENRLVLLLSHEIAAGKEGGGVASVLQLVPDFFIRGTQSQALRFGKQDFSADEVLGGALGKIGKQHGGLFAPARELLPQH